MGDRRALRRPRLSGVSRNIARAARRQTADELAEQMQAEIGARMAEIAGLFIPGSKVTVLVRRPEDNQADICVSDDEFPEIIAALQRCQAREAEERGGSV